MILYDDNSGENNSPFLNVQEAYSVLSDPFRRRSYDEALEKNRKNQQYFRQPDSTTRFYMEEVEPLIPEQGPVHLGDTSLAKSFQVHRPSFEALFDRFFSNFIRREKPKGSVLKISQ